MGARIFRYLSVICVVSAFSPETFGSKCSADLAQCIGLPDASADYLTEEGAIEPITRDPGLTDAQWEKELERRAAADGGTARWHIELASLAAQRGQRGKAERYLEAATRHATGDPGLQRRINLVSAQACAATGDFECAIDHWHEAAQANDGHAVWVPSSYAYALWALGREEQALAWYSAAVRSDVALGRASNAANVGRGTALNEVSRDVFNAWSKAFAPLQKTVVASVDIDTEGRISRIQFLESPLDESLISRIRSVVLRWQFDPAMKDGIPVTRSTHLYVDVRGRPTTEGDYAFEIQFAGLNILRERTEINYPREALRKGREGAVTLTVEIDEQGRMASTSIFQSSGSNALDVATQRMVASWRYVVDRIDGHPVASTKTEFFAFQLGGVETYEGSGPRSRYDRATRSHLTRPVGL